MSQFPIIFKSETRNSRGLQSVLEQMSRQELIDELRRRKDAMIEKTQLLAELELHQLELEIQNREVIDSYARLETLNQKYFDLYDSAPVGYMTLDRSGKIIELNQTFASMLKTDKTSVVGKTFAGLILKDCRPVLADHLDKCITAGDEKTICEIDIFEELPVQLHSTVSLDPLTHKPMIKVIVIDINERKRAIAAEQLAHQLNQEKFLRENYMSTLSHDLRTPLTSSRLCAVMLKDAMSDIGKKKRLFELMVQELDRADQMIKELLDASKIKCGDNLPLVLRRCDLGRLVRTFVNDIMEIQNRKINLRAEGNLVGKWSRDGLHRVIENLITNALKYGDIDQPVTLALEDLGHEVSIIVHNHGEPIPKRDQKKIFEAFHRTESAKNGLTIGWGLGLSLVHNIVMRHEGTIDVQSNATEGTSFIIRLPK